MGFTATGKETRGHLPWEGGGSGISPQDHLGPQHFVTEGRQFRAQPLGRLPRICLSSPSPFLPSVSVSLTFLSFLSHAWACMEAGRWAVLFLRQLLQHSWFYVPGGLTLGREKQSKDKSHPAPVFYAQGFPSERKIGAPRRSNCPSLLHTHFETKGQAGSKDPPAGFLRVAFPLQLGTGVSAGGTQDSTARLPDLSFPAVDLSMAPQTTRLC